MKTDWIISLYIGLGIAFGGYHAASLSNDCQRSYRQCTPDIVGMESVLVFFGWPLYASYLVNDKLVFNSGEAE